MLQLEYCAMLNRARIYLGAKEILFLTGVTRAQADIILSAMEKLKTELTEGT